MLSVVSGSPLIVELADRLARLETVLAQRDAVIADQAAQIVVLAAPGRGPGSVAAEELPDVVGAAVDGRAGQAAASIPARALGSAAGEAARWAGIHVTAGHHAGRGPRLPAGGVWGLWSVAAAGTGVLGRGPAGFRPATGRGAGCRAPPGASPVPVRDRHDGRGPGRGQRADPVRATGPGYQHLPGLAVALS